MFDAKRLTTDQLQRSYHTHVNDNGTWSMNQECRRLFLIQEIGKELRVRGIEPES